MFHDLQELSVQTGSSPQINPTSLTTGQSHPAPRKPNAWSAPILVVDDEQSIREIIVEMLELEGYAVEQAMNGAEALARIADPPPSLVLLDMRMPVLDGWGVARALTDRGLNVPIVVLTAARDAQKWATEIGAVGHLAKPFDISDLLAAVDRYRDRSRDRG